jgi:hypothetical protein
VEKSRLVEIANVSRAKARAVEAGCIDSARYLPNSTAIAGKTNIYSILYFTKNIANAIELKSA